MPHVTDENKVCPDVILSHDDWGSKNSLFMNPDTWREFFKEHYRRIYGYMKENGVLPSNDILAMQKRLDGKMMLMGGIDAAIVDRADSTEKEIRRFNKEHYGK